MTLQELMNETHGKEIIVHDTNYDMEAYFYGRSDWESEKEWQEENKAKQTLASLLDIEDLDIDTDKENITATVNLSGLIERNLDKLEQEDLFINPDINAIMDDMQNILAGYALRRESERLNRKFPCRKSPKVTMNLNVERITFENFCKTLDKSGFR